MALISGHQLPRTAARGGASSARADAGNNNIKPARNQPKTHHMPTRRIQVQPVYGAPSERAYCRLRLPSRMINEYIVEHGEERFLWVGAPDTLCLGGHGEGRVPIHILDVRERRGSIYRHFRQVMFPSDLAKKMRGGEAVEITRDGDTIQLRFGRPIFGAEAHAAAARPEQPTQDTSMA